MPEPNRLTEVIQVYDVLIIGAGPGGLSAGLQLARSNRTVLVFDRGRQRTVYAHNYRNYLGFPAGISGKELLDLGREQARVFGVEILQAEATGVRKTAEGAFEVSAGGKSFTGKRLIFATGVSDHMPKIPDVMNFMGTSVFHCLDCEGFELINKRVVVFGAKNSAADAALRILSFTPQVFIATHEDPLEISDKYLNKLQENSIEIVQSPILHLKGQEHILEKVVFADGSERAVDFGYSTAGSKPHNELALSLGVETIPNGHILVDKDMRTNLEHVYAAGDIVNSSQQVSLAVAGGVRAAIMLNKTLLKPNQKPD